MIYKTYIWQKFNIQFSHLNFHYFYIFWVIQVIPHTQIPFLIKNFNYFLWKTLFNVNIYPKDIAYYYKLYYATTNLTWYYSLKAQRKFRYVKLFNFLKMHGIAYLRKIIFSRQKYNIFYHKVLINNYIFKKINLFLYYKHYILKNLIKTFQINKQNIPHLNSTKFLQLINVSPTQKNESLFFNKQINLLTSLKESRQNHWTATNKITLNKRTYCNFLHKFLKFQSLYVKTALIFIFQQIQLTKSWKHSFLLSDLFYSNLNKKPENLKKGNILQFPKGNSILHYKKWINIKFQKRLWEQRKRQYLFTQSINHLWMPRKKNLYKKIEFNFYEASFLQNYYHYDFYTNSLCILRPINWNLLITKIPQFSYVLKLTKWRFKA